MPKATQSDIKFYKGVLLVNIHSKLVSDKTYMSIDELDEFLKAYSDLEGLSCSEMSHNQMQQLKEYCKQFAASINMGVDAFDKDKRINLNFNK